MRHVHILFDEYFHRVISSFCYLFIDIQILLASFESKYIGGIDVIWKHLLRVFFF